MVSPVHCTYPINDDEGESVVSISITCLFPVAKTTFSLIMRVLECLLVLRSCVVMFDLCVGCWTSSDRYYIMNELVDDGSGQ